MSWEPFPPSPPASAFGKARRRETYRRLAKAIRGIDAPGLLSVDEIRDRLKVFEQSYGGVRPIPIDRIVGTVDKTRDFGPDFLPRRSDMSARWRHLERVFPAGDFPPIEVFQLEDKFFVIDGHHRVAIAKQRGIETIDAEVIILRSRYKMPPTTDLGAIISAQHEQIFLEDSGLGWVRADADIKCSRPHGYLELLELVKVHGYNLSLERGHLVPPDEVAADWYDRIYRPTIDALRSGDLEDSLDRALSGDIFLYAYKKRLALFPERGDMTIEAALRESKPGKSMRKRKRKTDG